MPRTRWVAEEGAGLAAAVSTWPIPRPEGANICEKCFCMICVVEENAPCVCGPGPEQTFRQTQALREAVLKLEQELAACRAQLSTKVAELDDNIATGGRRQRDTVKVRVTMIFEGEALGGK